MIWSSPSRTTLTSYREMLFFYCPLPHAAFVYLLSTRAPYQGAMSWCASTLGHEIQSGFRKIVHIAANLTWLSCPDLNFDLRVKITQILFLDHVTTFRMSLATFRYVTYFSRYQGGTCAPPPVVGRWL